jgi:hypothetical protein
MGELFSADGRGFWFHNKEPDFPPLAIRDPALYRPGSDRLAVWCTQTNLPAKQQARLVDAWCELLPTLSDVRLLWFHSVVPQRLFEAACQVPGLQGMDIKWSKVTDLAPLAQCASLHYLRMGSSASVQSIEPLRSMTQLLWLELENLQKIDDISPLSSLRELQGLGYTGSISGGKPAIDSLAPLAELTSLRWLALHTLQVRDASLRPLGGLRDLDFLSLPNRYPVEEYAWLKTRLPRAAHDLDAYTVIDNTISCKKCRGKAMAMVTGKGGGWLCRTCEADKLEKAVAKFRELERRFAPSP